VAVHLVASSRLFISALYLYISALFSDVSGVERSDEEAAEEGLDLEVTAP
jgi:hypothetical protein